MKVYYIGNRYDGCYYVRCLLPMINNGWDGFKTSLRAPQASTERMVQGALAADIVVFQRPDCENKVKVVELLKKAGKKVVFDNDDTYIKNSGVPTQMLSLMDEKTLDKMNTDMMDFVSQADLVTTTTETLAKEYKKYSDNVVILPNMVDPDDWDEPIRNETDKVRIGLVGSVAANKDYEDIIPLLDYLKTRDDVQLVLFALPPKTKGYEKSRAAYKEEIAFWDQYDVEWHHFVPMEEYHEKLNSLALDIMLAPRHDSYFNRCKSNLKFLESSMLEIPMIATVFGDGFGPYDNDDPVREWGVKVGGDWIPNVTNLIDDKVIRRRLGQIAKEYVLANYNIQDKAHLWQDAYQKMYEN